MGFTEEMFHAASTSLNSSVSAQDFALDVNKKKDLTTVYVLFYRSLRFSGGRKYLKCDIFGKSLDVFTLV